MPKHISSDATREAALSCIECGAPGVSICSRCCGKLGSGRAAARLNPLQRRDPALYKRLDALSHVSLADNKELWDEFVVEIGAGEMYEHMPELVKIVQERKWATDALKPKEWIRQALARRVKKLRSWHEEFDSSGKRRATWSRVDRRSGALIDYARQPYTEFAVTTASGDNIGPEDVIDGIRARRELTRADGERCAAAATRDDVRRLRGMSLAERFEADRSALMLENLRSCRPAFDRALAEMKAHYRPLAKQMGLDDDVVEVIAVETLLWDSEPRTYLNYLKPEREKQIRNAWDRLSRRKKKPEFKKALEDLSRQTRAGWYREDRQIKEILTQGWERLIPRETPEQRAQRRRRTKYLASLHRRCVCGAADHRFCTCHPTHGPIGGSWAMAKAAAPRTEPTSYEVLTLPCDLPTEQLAVARAVHDRRRKLY